MVPQSINLEMAEEEAMDASIAEVITLHATAPRAAAREEVLWTQRREMVRERTEGKAEME